MIVPASHSRTVTLSIVAEHQVQDQVQADCHVYGHHAAGGGEAGQDLPQEAGRRVHRVGGQAHREGRTGTVRTNRPSIYHSEFFFVQFVCLCPINQSDFFEPENNSLCIAFFANFWISVFKKYKYKSADAK